MKYWGIIMFLGLLFYSEMHVSAQEEKYISLYLYNFTKFIEWPDEYKQGDFIIQIIGHKSVYDKLKELTANKMVGSQRIVVKNPASISEINDFCHILFIGYWQSRQFESALKYVDNNSTLLISEKDGFAQKGSVINFIIKGDKILYEINKSAATKHNLKLSSKVIELAEIVYN